MAHSLSAQRRHRRSLKQRDQNRQVRSSVRTAIKNLLTVIQQKNADQAKTQLVAVTRLLDKAASAGVLHKNHVARHKSRLAHRVAKLTASPASA